MDPKFAQAIQDGKAVKKHLKDDAATEARTKAEVFEQGVLDRMDDARAWVNDELPKMIAEATAEEDWRDRAHRVHRDFYPDSDEAMQLGEAIKRVVNNEVDGLRCWQENHDVKWTSECTVATAFFYIEWGTWREHERTREGKRNRRRFG